MTEVPSGIDQEDPLALARAAAVSGGDELAVGQVGGRPAACRTSVARDGDEVVSCVTALDGLALQLVVQGDPADLDLAVSTFDPDVVRQQHPALTP